MSWQLSVGMEIHVELKTKTKMFCGCPNDPFNSAPNTNVCSVCYSLPGALPLLNKKAIEMVVQLGQALNGQIAPTTFWARKNYFYPDLPKGYQISQSTSPLVEQAVLEIAGVKHRINRIHLEEDAGKMVHQGNKPYSLVNYNRAGVPLMELVTEPDFHSAAEAKTFCQELQRIMRSLELSDADMEKGQMRCEANISVSKGKELGTKVEVKNINSFRAVDKAIEYEFTRQVEALESGRSVTAETRNWDNVANKTVVMRTKETSADYRYFPEPDLPVVAVTVGQAKSHALPDERRQAIVALGAPAAIAQALVDKNLDSRMLIIDERAPNLAKEAAHLMLEMPAFAALEIDHQIRLLESKQQNGWTKKRLAEEVETNGDAPQSVSIAQVGATVTARGGTQSVESIGAVEAAMRANPNAVADYRSGKENAFHFLVGQVMAATKGKANIKTVQDELKKALIGQ